MGADAYQRYLEHHARTHPGTPALSEREFWRERMDWQDRNPQGRCC
ncbi:YbdD/YjiX family protein [Citricoccus sp. SGAir0253]|nr:YbdD/YjiX family protein [Citricoccus sp. SGAir0253]